MLQIVNEALEWILSIANDNSHGYDQTNRWGPDYDCASLVISAWQNIGVPVKTNGATYTGNMYDAFTTTGFIDVTNKVILSSGSGLLPGDVLLTPNNHTAMYVGSNQLVHASKNEYGEKVGGTIGDQTSEEICVRSYYNHPWTHVLRWTR